MINPEDSNGSGNEDRERADRKKAKAIAVAIDRRNETALDNDEWWDYIEEKIYKALAAVRAERDEEWEAKIKEFADALTDELYTVCGIRKRLAALVEEE